MKNSINGKPLPALLVKVEARDVFGNTLFYPANDIAEHFCVIAGRETLARRHLDRLAASPHFTVQSVAAASRPWGS